jgi:protein-tyrosine phosphatase
MAQTKSVLGAVVLSVAITTFAFPGDQTQLSGAANFRDIGGYQTSDGHKMKQHVIFRSGELSGLTLADQQTLESLHIRYEIDLRTDKDREESPTQWGKKVPEVIAISVGHPRNEDTTRSVENSVAELQNREQAQRLMQQATARTAIQGAPEIGEVIQRLARGAEPALIHCTAGKDRTGVTVAILMTLLQVPRDQVYLEYLKSNQAVDQQLERIKMREKAGASSGLSSLKPEVLRVLAGTEQSYIEAAFSAIDSQYGSFDAYVKDGLKITADQIQALRDRLLAP